MRKLKQIVFFSICVLICMCSCKGATGRKVATETMEYIERKGGKILRNSESKVAEEENVSNSYNKYKAKKKIRELFDEDNQQDINQPINVICPQCSGYGKVYATDVYGNILYDYYGTPQVTTCARCMGYGQITVYQ